jgi:hypothetical protein
LRLAPLAPPLACLLLSSVRVLASMYTRTASPAATPARDEHTL